MRKLSTNEERILGDKRNMLDFQAPMQKHSLTKYNETRIIWYVIEHIEMEGVYVLSLIVIDCYA